MKPVDGNAILAGLIPTYQTVTMTITPDLAREMLEHNTGNRPAKAAQIKRMAADMKAGRWHVTGEPIIFSRDGVLNDGQNRLMACVQAEASFRSDVRFGVDRAAFTYTGQAVKRTAGDVLSIINVPSANVTAAACRWVLTYRAGNIYASGSSGPSAMDVAEFYEANPHIAECARVGLGVFNKFRPMPASLAAGIAFLADEIDRSASDAFMDALASGANLPDQSPILALRRRLLDNAAAKSKLRTPVLFAMTILAWNAWRSGKRMKSLRVPIFGDKPGEMI